MFATTEQKARLLGLATGVFKMVLDGKRPIEPILSLLQGIKDDPNFVQRLLGKIMIVWTITVGGLPKEELLERLARAGREVNDLARDIASKPAFKTSAGACEVSFVRVRVGDLGFAECPTTTRLLARIKEVGNLCQPEDGPWLGLLEQPCGDFFWIALEPILDSVGSPGVFYVYRNNGGKRWLHADYAFPNSQWDLDGEIVFRLRK